MKSFFLSIVTTLTIFACASFQPNQKPSNSQTQLIVHYNGEEVHRRGFEHISRDKFEKLLGKQEIIMIFDANWCQACKITKRVVKEIKSIKNKVYYVNVDEKWVRYLMQSMEEKSIPLMIHIDKKGNILASKIGLHKIVDYLLNNKDLK